MCKGAGTFEFTEDRFFMREKVADETVTVAFVHGQGRIRARTENAWSKDLSDRRDVGLVS